MKILRKYNTNIQSDVKLKENCGGSGKLCRLLHLPDAMNKSIIALHRQYSSSDQLLHKNLQPRFRSRSAQVNRNRRHRKNVINQLKLTVRLDTLSFVHCLHTTHDRTVRLLCFLQILHDRYTQKTVLQKQHLALPADHKTYITENCAYNKTDTTVKTDRQRSMRIEITQS